MSFAKPETLTAVSEGHFGDYVSVGEGVFELWIHHGPGYRVYLIKRGQLLIVHLVGGDKGSQDRDIKKVHKLARELGEEPPL